MTCFNGEKRLAASVIAATIRDLISTKNDKTRNECFEFLTGKTEIAKHWFFTADIAPLRVTPEELLGKLSKKIDHQKEVKYNGNGSGNQ